jgi:hypothetical protein
MRSGIAIDFGLILTSDSSFRCSKDSVSDLSVFEEESIVGQCDRISIQICPFVVTAISLSNSIKRCQILIEIENLLNLCHPLIATLIGVVLPVESRGGSVLKSAQKQADCGSRLSRGYTFESAPVMDTDCDGDCEGDGEGRCTDCTRASVYARPRAAARG